MPQLSLEDFEDLTEWDGLTLMERWLLEGDERQVPWGRFTRIDVLLDAYLTAHLDAVGCPRHLRPTATVLGRFLSNCVRKQLTETTPKRPFWVDKRQIAGSTNYRISKIGDMALPPSPVIVKVPGTNRYIEAPPRVERLPDRGLTIVPQPKPPAPPPKPKVKVVRRPIPTIMPMPLSPPIEFVNRPEVNLLHNVVRWSPCAGSRCDDEELFYPTQFREPTFFRIRDLSDASPTVLGQVFGIMACHPQHTFLLVSEKVQHFEKLDVIWSPNVWLGHESMLLMGQLDKVSEQVMWLGRAPARIRFLMVEGACSFLLHEQVELNNVDWVIAGNPLGTGTEDETSPFVKVHKKLTERGRAFYFKGWYGSAELDGKLVREVPV